MDRISALRNVEDALGEFEDGELDLAGLERRVAAVLRTYATEFEEGRLGTYRVRGREDETGAVLVAPSPGEARDRAREVADLDPASVERLDAPDPGAGGSAGNAGDDGGDGGDRDGNDSGHGDGDGGNGAGDDDDGGD